ncbi:MAG: branched-chain amino acid ABC transporter substrate-binding protein, partial [Sedimenticola sp.]
MKKLIVAVAVSLAVSTTVFASNEIKIGILLGYTGPIESLTPGMAESAELAMKEVSDSGLLLGGKVLTPVRADST